MPDSAKRKILRYVPAVLIALILAAGAVVLFYRLGAEPFQDYDEATYAETTVEALAAHNFLTFTFLGDLDFRKPPLLYWLTGTANQFISSPEVADRLPSALAALALIGVVMLTVYAVTGNAYAAAFGGGALLATAAFIEPSRQVRFDILAAFFNTLCVYAFYRALASAHTLSGKLVPPDRRWFIVLGVFVGLAVLSKGPLVFFAFVPMLVLAAALRKWAWLKDPYFWSGVGVSLLVALPWYLYETLHFGMTFWNEYLGQQIVSRAAQDFFVNQPTNPGYLGYLFFFGAPWAELLCMTLVAYPFIRKHMEEPVRAWYLAMVAGILTVLLICFGMQTKAFSYLIPLYPYLALATAFGGFELYRIFTARERTAVIMLVIICLGWGLWWTVFNGWHASPYYASEIELAQEEHSIGIYLHAHGAKTFYIYNTTTLGSIMFYSQIIHPPWISTNANLAAGSYVLYQTVQAAQLAKDNPQLHLVPVYRGASLTLGAVAP